MELHSSGDNLLVFNEEQKSWVPLQEVYLEEAKRYRWMIETDASFLFFMQQVPLAMTKTNIGWEGVFETPFQSGLVEFKILFENNESIVNSYIYTDNRKMTEHQYNILLQELIEEAKICFQKSGLASNTTASGNTRDYSMMQWNYIESSIHQLRKIFSNITHQPLSSLQRKELLLKREKVTHITPRSIFWMERKAQNYGATPTTLPSHVQTTRVQESSNLYENRVILKNILDLEALLKVYRNIKDDEIQKKAAHYLNWITLWKKADFLQGLSPHHGVISVSQVFRKHPNYRLWYHWFQALYQYNKLSFDFGQKLALKDTFLLYEMWCYLQLIKILRQQHLLEHTSQLFTQKDGFFFLNLAENKESTIFLTNGAKLTYQKLIQINTSPYYSFTQRMIPDIVLEFKGELYIFDPKYRVASNLPMALGEMHKYRDGILSRTDDQQVVKEVYILTPVEHVMSEEKDFYKAAFQNKFGMGSFCLRPGDLNESYSKKISHIFGE